MAGIEVDRRGFDRNIIQFFHQSFQEYFAGQAIIHEHGVTEREGVVSRLRNLLESIEIQQREVVIWGNYTIAEPVIADYWQEALRLAIADLKPEEANDTLLMLLPDPTTPPFETRPRAVFALQCLADEPKVNQQTVSAVFDAMLDNLTEEDGFGTKINTWMDEAIAAIAESAWGRLLHDRLLEEYINSSDEQRNRIGCCLALRFTDDSTITKENSEYLIETTRVGLTSGQQTKRVQTALELMNRCYTTGGKLGFLTPDQQERLISIVLATLSSDEATESALIWALLWLTGAKNRLRGNKLDDVIQLEPSVITILEVYLQGQKDSLYSVNSDCLILTRDNSISSVVHQFDWIYELAVIADGGRPRTAFPNPGPTNRSASVDWLLSQLRSANSHKYVNRIAQTLGAFGVFIPEMVGPLSTRFSPLNILMMIETKR